MRRTAEISEGGRSASWVRLAALSGGMLAAGFFAGYFFPGRARQTFSVPSPTSSSSLVTYQLREGAQSLINPLLGCEVSGNGQLITAGLKDAVTRAAALVVASGDASQVSVYLRFSNDGRWLGVNENTPYAAASMLKVPFMIAYFKKAEKNPDVLNEKVTFTEPVYHAREQHYPPSEKLKRGTTYTVSELIDQMIIYSGNNAMNLLFDHLDAASLQAVFLDLGVPLPNFDDTGDTMSARNYSLFLRVLYNAAYLNDEYSQRALELLSKTDFVKGLTAGVPSGVTVAHKFGERGLDNPDGTATLQLHDCGIVYTTNRYLLCVMTKGSQWTGLEKTIAAVSRAVWQQASAGR